ncbi:hypothetical protein ELG72_37625 [Rhizobium leguminosarum]|nr:hypothetical protein ELG82_37475 [Rhizobium leguminosarum]TBG07129.1 hypothetical protein ELG80_37220 [Rhizobium leguminosarum]TBG07693.1 hypothetical protein ELG81_37525 [Rhizobium leguminosarum]TBG30813.1 hypothetical protein ELG75_36920 [Rhizobium leguminosarum]TBG50059.1 hypothetical protein ELG72_37625 [Rhizobium leguminosarum]
MPHSANCGPSIKYLACRTGLSRYYTGLGSLVFPTLVLSLAADIAIFGFKASVIAKILVCAVAGMTWTLVTVFV